MQNRVLRKTGKTVLSLQFPVPALIDTERGSEWYTTKFKFKILCAENTAAKVDEGIKELLKDKKDRPREIKDCQTVILDSITDYWEELQESWKETFLLRNKGKGNKEDYYDLQPKDWAQIKSDFKSFTRKFCAIDMNVICTCKAKDQYSEASGDFLKKIGETFDCDRSLPYHFDTVVKLDRDNEGRYIAIVEKDRTQALPKKFECFYIVFAAAFELQGWDEIQWPEGWLWANHKGIGLTGVDFAKDEPKATYKKEDKSYSGRQCLHIMAEKHEREEVRMISKKLLQKYPSQKKLEQPEKQTDNPMAKPNIPVAMS